MKLIMAIVNNSDVKAISEEMLKGGYQLTKIGTTGGLLKSGMTTLISAVRNDRVALALEIIRNSSHSRKYKPTEQTVDSTSYSMCGLPGEIVVGGATVFVLNVEESYKY